MNKKDIIIGFILGIFTSLLGSYLFITFFTKFDISSGIQTIKENGYLGKVITLGTTLDLAVFAFLLKKDKEFMAGGVILAVIILAISTLLT
jgi:cellulose synthase/poly-beta-1,6-N-acetylglucosamine synthase-like glycosyltransferase